MSKQKITALYERLSNRFLFSGQRAFQSRRLAVNPLFHAVFLLFLF